MLELKKILECAIHKNCSDVNLSVGAKIFGRIDSKLEVLIDETLTQQQMEIFAKEILSEKFYVLEQIGEIDTSFSISGLGRFKTNLFKQRGSIAICIKIVTLNIVEDFFIPPKILEFIFSINQGLVLITGSDNSGKNNTISTLIDKISTNSSKHIITLESSMEYLHKHNNSIVNQREVGNDTKSYLTGIEAVFKEAPDILIIDDIIDYSVLKMIFRCCEIGILVISGMYTNNVKNTLDSIISMDLSNNSVNFRNSLANVLRCVISQKKIMNCEEKNFYLFENMINTPSISNYIKENKTKYILPLMQNGLKLGMSTFDTSLIEAYKNSKISRNVFLQNISNKELATKIILNY